MSVVPARSTDRGSGSTQSRARSSAGWRRRGILYSLGSQITKGRL